MLPYRVLAESAPSSMHNLPRAYATPLVHSAQQYSHTLFPNGGTSSQALSDRGNTLVLLEDTGLRRSPALLPALTFLLSLLASLLLTLVYIALHSPSTAVHRWLIVALILGSLRP